MSGRSPYANGYGYPSDSGRSENGGYGSSTSLGVNGYGGSGAGGNSRERERERERDRRPGGYGGFLNDDSQRPSTSSSTVSYGRDRGRGPADTDSDRRGGGNQDRRPSAASSSRSRQRDVNVNVNSRRRPGRDENDYMNVMPPSMPEIPSTAGGGGPREAQSIEGKDQPLILEKALSLTRKFFFKRCCKPYNEIGISWQRMIAYLSKWPCN